MFQSPEAAQLFSAGITHTSKPTPKNYPLIADVDHDVVPELATSVVPVLHGAILPPCSLQMVHWIGSATLAFDSYPFCFKIPGCTMGDAHDFTKEAMKATACWTMQNCFHNIIPKPPTANKPKKHVPPFKYYFKLYFSCPQHGSTKLQSAPAKQPPVGDADVSLRQLYAKDKSF
ncbi:hypothetical protein PTTG_25389 [Puccinia triticina 1-1 BBBD Race 1]|uniref:Uncharacterized protein n=1 Tax=Puccinia triticina (isolate 1-1 / race 1 (BBBD)) TaxID=630390 RepID=A0A180H398_PUCT1|nr:hypothetical protein PTTG_25389 [Puccinia triticina 1-1 BBBD Race 1]